MRSDDNPCHERTAERHRRPVVVHLPPLPIVKLRQQIFDGCRDVCKIFDTVRDRGVMPARREKWDRITRVTFRGKIFDISMIARHNKRRRRVIERLDNFPEKPVDEAEYFDRPYGELAARICRDLGLNPDWSLWEDEPWAKEEAEYRERSGSPFAPPGWRMPIPGPPDDPPHNPRAASP